MKKTNRLSHYLIPICCLLFACGGSKDSKDTDSGFSFSASAGVKMDINTGTKTSYSGFAIDEIYIVDSEDKELSSNEVPIDTKFSIVYQGIENYTLKEGKAFPGLSLQVTDATGAYILNEADLLASYTDGFSEEDASVMRGSVTIGEPMVSGATYHCKMRVFDKNSDAEIISELDFKVK
ncbi:MAG: hypothetical protein IPK96_00785 [Flammeovirgaceae bacterium]|jgi:hypothetical protein|nr:hypothetical protein [Flammeovirgaceae bacterium]